MLKKHHINFGIGIGKMKVDICKVTGSLSFIHILAIMVTKQQICIGVLIILIRNKSLWDQY